MPLSLRVPARRVSPWREYRQQEVASDVKNRLRVLAGCCVSRRAGWPAVVGVGCTGGSLGNAGSVGAMGVGLAVLVDGIAGWR